MWQRSTPAGGRVADVEISLLRQDEEAVTSAVVYNVDYGSGGVLDEEPYVFISGDTGSSATEDGEVADAIVVFDDGERGLAAVVVVDELVGGSAAAPRPADGAAAEYVLWRQPEEDLVDDEPLRQVVENGRAAAVRHAGRSIAGEGEKRRSKHQYAACRMQIGRPMRKKELLRSAGLKERMEIQSLEDLLWSTVEQGRRRLPARRRSRRFCAGRRAKQ
jgi:hypothetical protein